MLDAGIALLRRQLDVGDLHVVLEVEERLRPELRPGARRHHPDRLERRLLLVRRRRRGRVAGREAQRLGRAARRAHAPARARPPRRARPRPPRRRARSPPRRGRAAAAPGRGRNRPRLVPVELPPQCDQRCTTGDQPPDIATASQAITSAAAPLAAPGAGLDAGDPPPALDAGHAAPFDDADAERARRLRQRPARRARASSTAGTARPAPSSAMRRAVGVVVVGDHHRPLARGDAPERQVVAHRAGEHHAWHVVAGEGQRPLDRAGRRHDPPRADPPEPPPRPGSPAAPPRARSRGRRRPRPSSARGALTFGIASSAASVAGDPVRRRPPSIAGAVDQRPATPVRAPARPASPARPLAPAARAAASPAAPPPTTSTSTMA